MVREAVSMSFIDIKDPTKRDQIVADYVATIRRVQQRNEDEKSIGLAKKAELERTFNPIVKATEKSTKAITEHLNPIHDELKTVSENLQKNRSQPRRIIWDASTGVSPVDFYQRDKYIDKYFSMKQADNDDLVLGEQTVNVDEHFNIIVEDQTYEGTPGLWALIMLASAPESSYDDDDERNYRDLAAQTNLLLRPRDVKKGDRPRATAKWKMLHGKHGTGIEPGYSEYLSLMRNLRGGNNNNLSRYENDHGLTVVSASGIFLPGDIKGLTTKLNLLLAEFQAGNTTTRNEIVSILDELLRRKRMSRKEYTSINNYLSNDRNPR